VQYVYDDVEQSAEETYCIILKVNLFNITSVESRGFLILITQ
jgi:hypothetical protein